MRKSITMYFSRWKPIRKKHYQNRGHAFALYKSNGMLKLMAMMRVIRPLMESYREKTKKPSGQDGFEYMMNTAWAVEWTKKTWQRPTLPRTSRSTIGDEAFHCRVRDGNVCFRFSMVTRKFIMMLKWINIGWKCFQNGNSNMVKPHGLLVPVSWTCCHAYTSGLSTS